MGLGKGHGSVERHSQGTGTIFPPGTIGKGGKSSGAAEGPRSLQCHEWNIIKMSPTEGISYQGAVSQGGEKGEKKQFKRRKAEHNSFYETLILSNIYWFTWVGFFFLFQAWRKIIIKKITVILLYLLIPRSGECLFKAGRCTQKDWDPKTTTAFLIPCPELMGPWSSESLEGKIKYSAFIFNPKACEQSWYFLCAQLCPGWV